MTDKPITAQDLEELFGKVDFEKLIRDEILKEGAEEIQRKYNHHLLTTLYGSNYPGSSSYEENGDKYIVIPKENYEYLMKPQDNSFFGKIKRGWKLFYYSLEEWYDVIYYDEFEEEFFDYLGRSIEDL